MAKEIRDRIMEEYDRKQVLSEMDRRLQFVPWARQIRLSALHGSGLKELIKAVRDHKDFDNATRLFRYLPLWEKDELLDMIECRHRNRLYIDPVGEGGHSDPVRPASSAGVVSAVGASRFLATGGGLLFGGPLRGTIDWAMEEAPSYAVGPTFSAPPNPSLTSSSAKPCMKGFIRTSAPL